MSKKVKTSAETEVEEEETQKSKLREFLEFIAPIVIALVVAMILKYCIFANAVIPTGSMLETIQKGDRVIASRLEYKFNDPERFDIAIFKYPVSSDFRAKQWILLTARFMSQVQTAKQ